RRAAALTLAGDAIKAIISCAYGYALYGFTGAYIAVFFCILGHCFPLYYHFKGGKGIVTVAFMVLMLDPIIFAVLLALFLILIIATRMVSFGSVICVMLFPLILYRLRGPGIPILFAMLITILVVFMHRENIMRIYRGQESKIDLAALFGRKKKEENKQQPSDEG
ncbi:MAG: glycerol-3-phosphate acyltransferase, partial [Clostridia bacterium]|nr:glycerol-3-phosphate acyltransferase [Clostridia bacterium]